MEEKELERLRVAHNQKLEILNGLKQHVKVIKAEVNMLVQDLKKATPAADQLILMKDIEKMQRQLEKVSMGVGSLIL